MTMDRLNDLFQLRALLYSEFSLNFTRFKIHFFSYELVPSCQKLSLESIFVASLR